jgi:hypothetical protein
VVIDDIAEYDYEEAAICDEIAADFFEREG